MEERLLQLQAKIEADASLAEKLFTLETPEEVQSLLKEEGLDFSLDEILVLKNALVKQLAKGSEGGELSDDDLEDVAGGIAVTTVAGIIGATFSAGNFVHNVSRGRW